MQSRPGAGGLALLLLVAALLACGGGNEERCTSTLDYQGKRSQGKGVDKLAAQHNACRAWCQTHASEVTSASERDRNHALVGCASRCGGDLLFGTGAATTSCP
ncbi:MAG: hypothetical protein IPI67_06400 [Myxococcales bacterium]|nr:hypothetical protein [Myxococcales bacterium]